MLIFLKLMFSKGYLFMDLLSNGKKGKMKKKLRRVRSKFCNFSFLSFLPLLNEYIMFTTEKTGCSKFDRENHYVLPEPEKP